MSKTHSSSKFRNGAAVQDAQGPVSTSGSRQSVWVVRDHELSLDGPVVMGIVNLTPDSFSDGGSIQDLDEALNATADMIDSGAAVVDIGGESTRPGAEAVSADEEANRILPFLREAVGAFDIPFCVDTRKSTVAQAALDVGASAVNDVSGLHHDPRMADVVATADAGLILMHMRGEPSTMSSMTDYDDLVPDVAEALGASASIAIGAGVGPQSIVVDPGIGFAKTAKQSLTLLRDLPALQELGFPVLVGPSRKSFLGAVLGLPPGERLEGTVAACVAAYLGGAVVFRVHDVLPVVRALAVVQAIEDPEVIG